MVCNNCGAWVEPGNSFCPRCGAPVANNGAPAANRGTGHTPPAYTNPSYASPAYAAPVYANNRRGAAAGARSASRPNILMIITGCLMLIASFLPMVKVHFGKLVDLAATYLGDLLPEIIDKLQFNIYGLVGFVKEDPLGLGIPDYVKVILIVAIVFMLLTIAVTIIAGATGNKALKVVSAVMCLFCLIACVAYMIVMGNVVDRINEEIAASLGEYGSLIGGTLKIKGIHGLGMYLFMVSAALQSVLALRAAVK